MEKPSKKLPPPKNHQLTIRFAEELYNVLTADAAAAGMPRAEYIRQLITNRKTVVKQEIVFNNPELLQVFRNLGHYGANLISWRSLSIFWGKIQITMLQQIPDNPA